MEHPFNLRKIVRDSLRDEIGANMMLAAFYGIEMHTLMGWSVEARWWHLTQTQTMIQAGSSVLVIAEDPSGMPIGVLVYTQIKNRQIRRIEALSVLKPFQGMGIGKALLNKAKSNKALHVFATQNSVSWYKKQGLKVIGNHVDGSVEMTTAKSPPKYTYDLRVPMPTEFDRKFIEEMKSFEASLPI